jgi:beta-glucosidase
MLKSKLLFLIITLFLVLSFKNNKDNTPVYLDKNKPVNQRVEDLMNRMTLEEKVGQMCQFVGLEHMKQAEKNLTKEELLKNDAHGFYPGIHSSDIELLVEKGTIGSFLHVLSAEEANELQSFVQKSRLKIPLLIGIDAIHGNGQLVGPTVYPTPIGQASAWDTDLVYKMSKETATEMRALGATWTFTPNVDVARDSRWGRVGETFGEDPFLVSVMGIATVKGFQDPENGNEINALACAKHLIAGSEAVNGTNSAPTDLSERTLREVFLPPYQAAIKAGVKTMMTAHNELNGIPCHADKWMMTDMIRTEFGFDGFYVSDWTDVARIATLHAAAENMKESCYQTVDAGMDMHMHGPGFHESVVALVKEGRISVKRIDESVRMLLEAKFKLGLFENSLVNIEAQKVQIFHPDHQKTALEAAQKSIVLLKNENNLLPLTKGKFKKIFVTGPNADNQTVNGDWVTKQPEEKVITVLEGLRTVDANSQFDFLDVGSNLAKITKDQVAEAKLRASKAELAIVVVGENSFRWDWKNKTCGENVDRSDLGLFGLQQELVESVYASGTPVLVVLVNGRPLATEWIAINIPVIVEAWEPGCKGGLAIAQILYGDVNPSAKLPITIPRSVGHLLQVYNHKPSQYTHEFVDSKSAPLYPFGFGLSYSTYQYDNLKLNTKNIKTGESLTVSIDVTNTSKIDGDEVVQLYLRDKVSSVTRPVKELKGFQKISLKAGEKKTVNFEVNGEMMKFYNREMKRIIEPGEFIVMVGKSSDTKDLLSASFFVK